MGLDQSCPNLRERGAICRLIKFAELSFSFFIAIQYLNPVSAKISVIPADPQHAFHEVDWSTERVMEQTRARLTAMNWGWSELPPLWDIDRKEDFERLAELFPDARALSPQSVALT